jgi:hypothetical protein
VTHIGDREADIYEEWATVPDQSNHVLVRVRTDRCLLESTETLYSQLSKQPCAGTYHLRVTADHRIGRTARIALMNVRFTQVQIQRPANLTNQDYPPSISLYTVEVEEVNPPDGQVAVHWRLMTTHEVSCLEQALRVLQWYRWRWRTRAIVRHSQTGRIRYRSHATRIHFSDSTTDDLSFICCCAYITDD